MTTPIDTTRLRADERITGDEMRALREMHAEGPHPIANAVAFNALRALLDEVERLRATLAAYEQSVVAGLLPCPVCEADVMIMAGAADESCHDCIDCGNRLVLYTDDGAGTMERADKTCPDCGEFSDTCLCDEPEEGGTR